MKKRIIAILLSLSIMVGSSFISKRAHAAAAVTAGVSIFVFAWELLDLMTGKDDACIAAIQTIIENGVDGLTNPDSTFQQNFGDFWLQWESSYETICESLSAMSDEGEIDLTSDNVKISYQQYLNLCNQVCSVIKIPTIDLICGYEYKFISADLSVPIPLKNLPIISEYFYSSGQSYSPIWYNKDTIVFPCWYLIFRSTLTYDSTSFAFYSLSDTFKTTLFSNLSTSAKLSDFFTNNLPSFYSPSLSSLQTDFYIMNQLYEQTGSFDSCFVFSNGTLSFESISSFDTSEMQCCIVTTQSDYPAFLQSLIEFTPLTNDTDINDLSDVLPTEVNPDLSFPVNPDLDIPISDQVIVSNVPDTSDAAISDYPLPGMSLDISVPSIIVSKFPFSLPFDFVRFLGVLAADPIPPVFHIPISTHPDNLAEWADNETVGQYVSPDNPMFEIDEQITIDLSNIPLVQPICYTCFIVGFVIFLIHITPKLIHH